MTTATKTPMLRWSSVRDCPRKAVYEATGAPARERTPREERILWRGKTLGRDYADLLAAQHGENAIERERKVIWPLGVGHIDVYMRETCTVIEVLSSAHASPAMVRSKLIQAVGYATYDPDADNACLIILNPSDYSEERIIVTPGSPQWDALAGEVEDRVATVLSWRDHGEMPQRVCARPADAWGHFCLHAAHCFEGWQPEPLTEIQDPATVNQAARLYAAKEHERNLKSQLKLVEEERRQVETELAERIDVPAAVQVGGYQVKRSERRRDSFKLAQAKADSRFEPGLLAEFTSRSEFTVWTVEKSGHGDIDYGDEVPF